MSTEWSRSRRSHPRFDGTVWILLCCTCALAGCTRHYSVSSAGPQAYYRTGSPIHDTSQQLARIADALRRVGVTAYYTTYRFAQDDSITDADLRDARTYARARERYDFDQSKVGSATIIAVGTGGVTLITNDHVIRTPDTVIVHFRSDPRTPTAAASLVESVSIRTGQRSFVHGMPDPVPFAVSARDSAADLALITVPLPSADRVRGLEPLHVAMGDAARLSWGSFVYILGFPRGHRMVTRGIVSDPGYRPDDAFLIDGLFNRGISGGIILAVRGDTGALEWVGLASAASAEPDDRLRPEVLDLDDAGLLVPYEGPLYVERASRIAYGVTYPVSITLIRRFLTDAAR